MTQILGIKLSDHGPVFYFSSGQFVVQKGQAVLVETDQGLSLGRVVTIAAPEQKPAQPAQPVQPAQPAQIVETLAAGDALSAPFEPAPFEAGFSGADWDEADTGEETVAAPAPAPALPEHEGHIGGDGENTVVMDYTQPQAKPKGLKGLAAIVRLARDEDLEAEAENRRLARRAHTFCRGCINDQRLDMKLVDVEVLLDRGKMIFYFTAPGRIDFRELIKCLVREFHTRIELRQIGVRHETQMLGAIGNCGQVCCCRRFLRKFAPVTIKMAKEQNLFLNPAKISGICGRLLCCLSYEQKGYEEFHKQCPKIGKRVQTPLGSLKVLRANFFKKSISVWMEEGGEREFTLDEWREMLGRPVGDGQAAAASPQGQAPQGQQARGGDRPERSDRSERSDRGGRRGGERGPRPERPERSDRPDRSDRPERSDRPDRPDRPERTDRAERPERSDRPDRPERTDRPDRPERSRAPRPAPQGQPGAQPENSAAAGAPGGDQGADGAARKPRRKRRKPRGPKPEN